MTAYNNRLQPLRINATEGSSLLTLTFGYGTASANNGNVLSQRIEAPGSPSALDATQYYLYDELNRLGIVTEGAAPTNVDNCGSPTWCRDFGYDRYGNRAVINAVNGGLSLATPTATSAYTASTNRLTSSWANYDAAGNITAFVKTGYEWSAFYDAENKQRFYCDGTTAACSSSNDTAEYVYDGEGNRVKKITSSETTTYVYDAFGRLAAEYSTAGPSGTAGSYFRTTDHLGSMRLVTDENGDVYDRRDFFPFGEKILASSTYSNRQYVTGYNNSDPASAHLFTAKERDEESNLDYFLARYYSSSLGRFNSVDPANAGAAPSNPQSWNGYSYVFNNPQLFVDPTGKVTEICGLGGEDDCSTVAEDTADAFRQDNSYIVAGGNIYLRSEDGTQGQHVGTFAYQGPDGELSAAGQSVAEDLEGRADQSNGAIAEFAGAAVAAGTGGYAFVAGAQAANAAAFGPATGRLFWSGGARAYNAALALSGGGSGLRMIDQTRAGRIIDAFAQNVPRQLGNLAWRVGSRFFASGAQGPVQAVVRNPRPDSVFMTTELPRLAARPGGLSTLRFR